MPTLARPVRAQRSANDAVEVDTRREFMIRMELIDASRTRVRQQHDMASAAGSMFARLAGNPLFQLGKATATRESAKTKREVELLKVVRVQGDGRCMFRALALGIAANKGKPMIPSQETFDADQLRTAVAEVMCASLQKRGDYPEAAMAIKMEMSFDQYCKRIVSPSFWGGEAELLVLSKLLKTPIQVYLPESQAGGAKYGLGFVKIQEYGSQFHKTKSGAPKKVVKLLYNGNNHYDLLLQ